MAPSLKYQACATVRHYAEVHGFIVRVLPLEYRAV